MRKCFADRGMSLEWKYPRRRARDSIARDNEEAIIGTQLRLGISDCHLHGLAKSGER